MAKQDSFYGMLYVSDDELNTKYFILQRLEK